MSKSLSDSNELESAAGGLADRGMSMFVAVYPPHPRPRPSSCPRSGPTTPHSSDTKVIASRHSFQASSVTVHTSFALGDKLRRVSSLVVSCSLSHACQHGVGGQVVSDPSPTRPRPRPHSHVGERGLGRQQRCDALVCWRQESLDWVARIV